MLKVLKPNLRENPTEPIDVHKWRRKGDGEPKRTEQGLEGPKGACGGRRGLEVIRGAVQANEEGPRGGLLCAGPREEAGGCVGQERGPEGGWWWPGGVPG